MHIKRILHTQISFLSSLEKVLLQILLIEAMKSSVIKGFFFEKKNVLIRLAIRGQDDGGSLSY